MNVEQEKLVMKAMTKTLYAYEQLIAYPTKNHDAWLSWTCRVCWAMNDCGIAPDSCKGCPLEVAPGQFCGFGAKGRSLWGSKKAVLQAIREGRSATTIRNAARARYRELLRRLKINGYEYK